jgi:MFS transporter, FSR family, fosmidomycin resistance protein
MQESSRSSAVAAVAAAQSAALPLLFALSFSHLLNDVIQSLVPAIYPIIKNTYALDYGQIGLITLAFQLCASVFQPFVGMYTDRRPQPYSLLAGMAITLVGLMVLAHAASYPNLLIGAALIGTGSSIFHPEATRMARMASGGRYGFAQSVFQVGGQAGIALGPLLAAFIVVPLGQSSLSWFSLAALLAMFVVARIGHWYKRRCPASTNSERAATKTRVRSQDGAKFAVAILIVLMFSKSAYSASFSSYYTFYLLGQFHVSVQASQVMLFLFLLASPIGALIGGHLGDRIGRRKIIWFSILGAVPFTLALPYVNLLWTGVLAVIIGMIMASAFPAILVYAIELLPGRLGMVAGLFYGLTFGLGALSAALLGGLADATSIETVFHICAYLPLIGLLTWFLPDIRRGRPQLTAKTRSAAPARRIASGRD